LAEPYLDQLAGSVQVHLLGQLGAAQHLGEELVDVGDGLGADGLQGPGERSHRIRTSMMVLGGLNPRGLQFTYRPQGGSNDKELMILTSRTINMHIQTSFLVCVYIYMI